MNAIFQKNIFNIGKYVFKTLYRKSNSSRITRDPAEIEKNSARIHRDWKLCEIASANTQNFNFNKIRDITFYAVFWTRDYRIQSLKFPLCQEVRSVGSGISKLISTWLNFKRLIILKTFVLFQKRWFNTTVILKPLLWKTTKILNKCALHAAVTTVGFISSRYII